MMEKALYSNMVGFAKRVVETGHPANLEKHQFIAAIRKRADEIRRPGETDEKAFTRCITDDPDGIVLYKASKIVPGQEVAPVEPVPAPKPEIGPAEKEMQMLADDHLKANPKLSPAAAYSQVYTHPNNAALREKCKAEHMAKVMKMQAA